jgi:hypothetical protein
VKGVEAERDPGAVWEVYVGPQQLEPDPKSPWFVGVFALFGAGLKTRRDHYHPAEFVYPIDRAISAAGDGSKLHIHFVPVSGVEVKGRPQAVKVQADVKVAEMDIVVDVVMEQPPKDEQDELRREEMQQ